MYSSLEMKLINVISDIIDSMKSNINYKDTNVKTILDVEVEIVALIKETLKEKNISYCQKYCTKLVKNGKFSGVRSHKWWNVKRHDKTVSYSKVIAELNEKIYKISPNYRLEFIYSGGSVPSLKLHATNV